MADVLPCKNSDVCDGEFLPSLTIDDHCRVVLESRPGDEGSDYINASFVDVRTL